MGKISRYSGVALRQLAEVEQAQYLKCMYWIYAIYNRQSKKFYIGQTENIKERLDLHNNHRLGGYTARFPGKWELIHKESVATRSEALKREKQLKSFRGREFIKQYIPG